MLGTDVRSATPYTLATIGNEEAIAIDQDPLGVQGMILGGGMEPTPCVVVLLVINRLYCLCQQSSSATPVVEKCR